MSYINKKLIIPIAFTTMVAGIGITKTEIYQNIMERRYKQEMQKADEFAYQDCDNKMDSLWTSGLIKVKAAFSGKSAAEYKLDKYREHKKSEQKQFPEFWAFLTGLGALWVVYQSGTSKKEDKQ